MTNIGQNAGMGYALNKIIRAVTKRGSPFLCRVTYVTSSGVPAPAAAAVLTGDSPSGGEFLYRESHTVEGFAGAGFGGLFAFLFGDAGLGCADEVLFGSLKPYDREEAERDREASLSAVDKAVSDAVAEPFGYLTAAAAAATMALVRFDDSCSEYHGLRDLHYSGRVVGAHLAVAGDGAEAVGRLV